MDFSVANVVIYFVIYLFVIFQILPDADSRLDEADKKVRRITFYVLLAFGLVVSGIAVLVWAKQQGLF